MKITYVYGRNDGSGSELKHEITEVYRDIRNQELQEKNSVNIIDTLAYHGIIESFDGYKYIGYQIDDNEQVLTHEAPQISKSEKLNKSNIFMI